MIVTRTKEKILVKETLGWLVTAHEVDTIIIFMSIRDLRSRELYQFPLSLYVL